MPQIAGGHTLRLTENHGQYGLTALQSLNLGFLVYAQDDRIVGRIHVETHDVADFLDEEIVGAEGERTLAMRLKFERAPDPADRTLAHAKFLRKLSRAPMGLAFGCCVERCSDDLFDRLV